MQIDRPHVLSEKRLQCFSFRYIDLEEPPNGWRYAPHGPAGYCVSTPVERPGKGDESWWTGLGTIPAFSPGTRQHHFDGTGLKPRNLPENGHAALRQSHHDSPGALLGVECTLC